MTDDDTNAVAFDTADEAIAAAWSEIEAGLVQRFEHFARDLGADEATVARTRDHFTELLRQAWASRRETARMMLEAHAINLH